MSNYTFFKIIIIVTPSVGQQISPGGLIGLKYKDQSIGANVPGVWVSVAGYPA